MKAIDFNNRFDAIVCLNSILPDKEIFDFFGNIKILAADGAANNLYKIGIESDFIIGDLDSLENGDDNIANLSAKLIHLPDQNTNDFEKTLDFAYNNGMQNNLIFGFHGGELEHTLNNWSIFLKYSEKMNLCIFDADRYGFSIRESISINFESGEMISLIPQQKVKLITKGLKWELNNEILKFGEREGARNVAVDGRVSIEMLNGSLLLFCNARLPYAPLIKL